MRMMIRYLIKLFTRDPLLCIIKLQTSEGSHAIDRVGKEAAQKQTYSITEFTAPSLNMRN